MHARGPPLFVWIVFLRVMTQRHTPYACRSSRSLIAFLRFKPYKYMIDGLLITAAVIHTSADFEAARFLTPAILDVHRQHGLHRTPLRAVVLDVAEIAVACINELIMGTVDIADQDLERQSHLIIAAHQPLQMLVPVIPVRIACSPDVQGLQYRPAALSAPNPAQSWSGGGSPPPGFPGPAPPNRSGRSAWSPLRPCN